MPLSLEAKKALREEGRKRELGDMSAAKKVVRQLTNGRPPASELRTPHAALVAAKTLHNEIDVRMCVENAGNYDGVVIAYVTPDLSVLGFTPIYSSDNESQIERTLTGNIALGLVFGIEDGDEMVMGARPFLVTKQTDTWLGGIMEEVRITLAAEADEASY
jgi:hypothetical protein